MPKYAVTFRESRLFELLVTAADADEAMAKAVDVFEHTMPEPDSSSVDYEDCEVAEVKEPDRRTADRIDAYDRDDLDLSPDY
jgi:hypothetical protein